MYVRIVRTSVSHDNLLTFLVALMQAYEDSVREYNATRAGKKNPRELKYPKSTLQMLQGFKAVEDLREFLQVAKQQGLHVWSFAVFAKACSVNR